MSSSPREIGTLIVVVLRAVSLNVESGPTRLKLIARVSAEKPAEQTTHWQAGSILLDPIQHRDPTDQGRQTGWTTPRVGRGGPLHALRGHRGHPRALRARERQRGHAPARPGEGGEEAEEGEGGELDACCVLCG